MKTFEAFDLPGSQEFRARSGSLPRFGDEERHEIGVARAGELVERRGFALHVGIDRRQKFAGRTRKITRKLPVPHRKWQRTVLKEHISVATLRRANDLAPADLQLVAGRGGETGDRFGGCVPRPEVGLRPAELRRDADFGQRPRDGFVHHLVDHLVRQQRGGEKRVGQLVGMKHRPPAGRPHHHIDAVGAAPLPVDLRRILVAPKRHRRRRPPIEAPQAAPLPKRPRERPIGKRPHEPHVELHIILTGACPGIDAID